MLRRNTIAKIRKRMPVLDPKAVGRRIRKARKSYEWSLADLADATGIARSTIACYECGSSLPIRDNLLSLSVALRRSMDYLLVGKRTWLTRR